MNYTEERKGSQYVVYRVYAYRWQSGKLLVEYDAVDSVRPFSISKELGIVVGPFNGRYYSTEASETGNHYSQKVDCVTMIAFLGGKIGPTELENAARHVDLVRNVDAGERVRILLRLKNQRAEIFANPLAALFCGRALRELSGLIAEFE
ncbi:MAG: hypothetical protein WAN50_00805 [Minisyncoccia bacterium]